jgi:retinoid hydroxylase
MAEPQETRRPVASHPSASPVPAAPSAAPAPGSPAALTAPAAPLPPGDAGLPLLGETLPFLRDGFGFVASRTARHGPIWQTRILGRRTAVLAGPDASGRFIDSEVQRAGAMPPHVQELFGGSSLPLLDGDPHLSRKTFILQAFTRDALAGYLPVIERMVAAALERWSAQEEIVWIPELKRLSIEVICATVMGIPPGAETAALRADYQLVLRAFSHLPVPLPGTAYSRGRAALARILARFEAAIADHRREPRDDGLSRILAATDGAGRQIGVEECKVELHHLIIAGLIVFAELAAIVQELTRHPDVRARLEAEVAGLPEPDANQGVGALPRERREGAGARSGSGLTHEALAGAPYLLQVVMEVKRLCPILPVVFGKARQSFEFKGRTVPAGWMVLWAHRASHVTAEIYPDPERFDPERFAPTRGEHLRHPYAFVPHGAGPAHGHCCPGTDFATTLMQVFTILLLRGYTWELPAGQDLDYDWSLIPPESKDGLRARVRRR